MAYKYFKNAFAISGDKTAVPETSPPNGSVSYTTGFGPNYEANPSIDPNALPVPRDQTNQVYYDITLTLQQYQQYGVPEFITSAMNGGSPYSYGKYAYAAFDPGSGLQNYQSLVAANTADPTDLTKWRLCDYSADKVTIDGVSFAVGVANGDVVYWDSVNSWYDKALADGTVKQNVVGIADVTNKRVIIEGEPALLSGLTVNNVYYLSTTTPGAVTNVLPTQNAVRLGVAKTVNQLILNIIPYINENITVASVSLSTSQSLPGGNVNTLVQFDTVEYDANGLWVGTPDYAFQIQENGYYEISAAMYILGVGVTNSEFLIEVWKNGAVYKRINEQFTNGDNLTLSGAVQVPCVVGDKITLYAANAFTGAVNMGVDATRNYFQIQKIG